MRDESSPRRKSVLRRNASGSDMQRMIGEQDLGTAPELLELESEAAFPEPLSFAPEISLKLALLCVTGRRGNEEQQKKHALTHAASFFS